MKSWFNPLLLLLPVFSASCSSLDPTSIMSKSTYGSNTDNPDHATSMAFSSTPEETVQDPTIVKIPTLLSPTEIPPSPTVEPSPTAPEDALERVTWEDLIWRIENIPEGAVILDDLPTSEWEKQRVTGPGKVYYNCGIEKDIKIDDLSAGTFVNLTKRDTKHCGLLMTTKSEAQASIPKDFPNLSPEEQEAVLQKILQLLKIFPTKISTLSYPPYFDAFFYPLIIVTEHHTDVEYVVYRNPYPDADKEWTVIRHIVDSPLSSPTPAATPQQ